MRYTLYNSVVQYLGVIAYMTIYNKYVSNEKNARIYLKKAMARSMEKGVIPKLPLAESE